MTPARRLATEVKARAKLPGARFDDLVPLCDLVLRKHGSPAAPFKGETRKQAKAQRREIAREETARIRDERMRIALGRCEAVMEGYPQGRCLVISPLHMHHTLGGSGRRRKGQSVENVRMLCWKHHREAHHG